MGDNNRQEQLKQIPAVDKILNWPEINGYLAKCRHDYIATIVRSKVDEFRQQVRNGVDADLVQLKQSIVTELDFLTKRYFCYAINGLGVILHTGLGRACFVQGVDEIAQEMTKGFSRLQIDDEGRRDDRYRKISKLLQVITGCEAGLIVNNNAAATLLVLSALAKGKEVVVSRGQLIEIGGSYRLPEILAQSGAILREVGTTNRTHLKDYQQAINEQTGLILKVHQSNYRILGFTKEVSLSELVALGKRYNIPVVDDLGSGALIDFSKYGLPKEPIVQESIQQGADIVCFSGDKIIGGPQCGVIVGKKIYIDQIKKHPLTRALRCDKLTNAILEVTLQTFLLNEDEIIKRHNVIGLMLKPLKEIKAQANRVRKTLQKEFGSVLDVSVIPVKSEIGGGSLSTEELASYAVAIKSQTIAIQELAKKLRQHQPPIFGRIVQDALLLDFRTVLRGEEKIVIKAFKSILSLWPN